ncbi:MAG TPA: ShlB/FhaC/HecB family hemolysin secretion/activation protein [Burkholderiales bacterium]|nr:ShlB/FhaC/HecB family hemolysin secretion/activation protein [Burkholderiales bacterium]
MALAPAAFGAATEPRFAVRAFEIEGEVPIGRERALAILAPYTGESVELAQLQNATSALEAELIARGFPFYRVVLPPQSLDGTVTIRVLPFKLAKVEVTGNTHFPTENILASLPALRTGESPNISAVGRNRSAANEHPSKELDITFRPSDVPDSIDVEVKVRDERPLSFFVGLNNIGDRRTGVWRTTAGVQHSNLWGLDHSVTATYTTSPEKTSDVKQYGLFYRAPFYSVSGALTLFYAYSDVNSGLVANAFQVSGRGRFSGIHWKQHLTPHGAYSHAVELGLDDRFFDNDVRFAAAQLGVDVRSRPVSVTYQARLDQAEASYTGGLQYVRNLGGGSDNNDAAYMGNRAGAARDWNAVRYTLDAQWRIPYGALGLRVRGQHANEPLIPGEQFGLGGASSIRGLREREVAGDVGISATLEALFPMPWEGVNAIVFVDAGEARVKNVQPGQLERQGAMSAGLGLRWAVGRRFYLALDAAQVIDGTTASLPGDRRIHIAVVYRF